MTMCSVLSSQCEVVAKASSAWVHPSPVCEALSTTPLVLRAHSAHSVHAGAALVGRAEMSTSVCSPKYFLLKELTSALKTTASPRDIAQESRRHLLSKLRM